MNKPDILIFFSDQHNAMYSGFAGDKVVKTPNLDKLASNGTVFDSAYTACPLCVPARIAFLTGCQSWKTCAYTNGNAISDEQATFMHSLAVEGYETVLCGRMHFVGPNQRHGFTKRIMGDITTTYWGKGEAFRREQGPYNGTLSMGGCEKLVGGGNSPVLEYDRAVVRAALDYLKQDHEKPQCIVVGTYGPHFPYVAPPKWYQYYKSKLELLHTNDDETNYDKPKYVKQKQKSLSKEHILNIRAAYYGMISHIDELVGEVINEWKNYLARKQRKGLFVYMSDHGDMAGEHDLYGKQTFYEGSVRIPLIFEGLGVKDGNRIKAPVSITDIGPTLCELTGAVQPAAVDGKSLLKEIMHGEEDNSRYIISEYIEKNKHGDVIPGRMVRHGNWKLISYAFDEQHDLLFNLESDTFERHNLIHENPEKANELRQMLEKNWDITSITEEYKIKQENAKLLAKWGSIAEFEEQDRWTIPAEATELPEIE